MKHRRVTRFTRFATAAWRLVKGLFVKSLFVKGLFVKSLLLLEIALATTVAHAEIYKWVDADGNTHFGDKAPDSANAKVISAEATRIGTTFSPPATSATTANPTGAPANNTNNSNTNNTNTNKNAATAMPQNIEPPPIAPAISQNSVVNANNTDLCKKAVGACFDETQDFVCKLRYGARCDTIYFWKVCRYQRCESDHWTDKCNSTFDYFANRPAVIGKRDLHRTFPLQKLVSAADWKCLSTSGFYCDELTNEDVCQANYHQSCDQLRHWIDTVKSRCSESRDNNCEDISNLMRYRPVSEEEAKKSKIKMAHDLWLEELNIVRESDATEAQFKPLFEALPGLNLGVTKEQHECHLPER